MSNIDVELDNLLDSLEKIQEVIGVNNKDKKSDDRKGGSREKVDKFTSLKDSIYIDLRGAHILLSQKPTDARDRMKKNIEIQKLVTEMKEKEASMRKIHSGVLRQKSSKMKPEEKKNRSAFLTTIAKEINEIERTQRQNTIGKVDDDLEFDDGFGESNIIVNFDDDDGSGGKGIVLGGGFGVNSDPNAEEEELSQEDQLRLQQVRKRDEEMDRKFLDAIEEGLETLQAKILLQNDELHKQSIMIDNMSEGIDKVQDHLESINNKMKKVLAESARSADKLCMDIICIVILLTLVGIIYTMLK